VILLYIIAVLSCLLVVELFMRLPLFKAIKELSAIASKSSKVVSSAHISDHWKEKILPQYAKIMALRSLSILFWLLLIFALVIGFIVTAEIALSATESVLNWLATYQGITAATVFSLVYYWLRKRRVTS
tara:strand:- start:4852 stop:5238 length:387 start_codon:yes stop_codon:yes gene_type:complete